LKKLAIINTHPIQYYSPVWRILAAKPDLETHVFYGSDFSIRGYRDAEFGVRVQWDSPLTEGYAHTFLSTTERIQGLTDPLSYRPVGLADYLRAFQPDYALVTAYMPSFWWEVLWILRSRKVPILFRAEVTDVALTRGAAKQRVRSRVLSSLYRHCAGALAIGTNSRNHYLAHGVPPERIGWAPYCADSVAMEKQVVAFSSQREAIRRELGFSEGHTVFIYSGKLVPKKDPMTLARALAALPAMDRERLGLLVVGDGELRGAVEAMCRAALGERLVMAGFVNQSGIGRYYAAADCLVLPSAWGETWGLVVNEAMQFGLPVIVSDRVGCHPDLVVPGRTGAVFPAGNAVRLRECLRDFLGVERGQRRVLAERCKQQIGGYSSAAAAEGIYIKALGVSGRRIGCVA
jgi:glycosyltransferase involved in cell wall biosynthesis